MCAAMGWGPWQLGEGGSRREPGTVSQIGELTTVTHIYLDLASQGHGAVLGMSQGKLNICFHMAWVIHFHRLIILVLMK